jgi:hypothetical protein
VNTRISLRSVGLALAVGVPLLLAPSVARAGFLPITFAPGAPIISGSNGSLTYNASTGDFSATVTAPTLTYAASFVNPPRDIALITSPKLTIDLTVDTSGNFVASGTGLSLLGSISFALADGGSVTFAGTSTANPLLSGTITNFGAQPAGPPSLSFDGTFAITGGALTTTQIDSKGNPVFGGFPLGGPGGFILVAENVTGGTLGDFSRSFSSSSVKPTVGDLAVPEPDSLALLLTGAAALLGWRRARYRPTARAAARPTTC